MSDAKFPALDNWPLFSGSQCNYCHFNRRSRLARLRHATVHQRRGQAYRKGSKPMAIVLPSEPLIPCEIRAPSKFDLVVRHKPLGEYK